MDERLSNEIVCRDPGVETPRNYVDDRGYDFWRRHRAMLDITLAYPDPDSQSYFDHNGILPISKRPYKAVAIASLTGSAP